MGLGLLLLTTTALRTGAGPACGQTPGVRFDGRATAVIAPDWRDSAGLRRPKGGEAGMIVRSEPQLFVGSDIEAAAADAAVCQGTG